MVYDKQFVDHNYEYNKKDKKSKSKKPIEMGELLRRIDEQKESFAQLTKDK